jgi:NADH:ubiquinone oxidoreductase subunit E
MVISICIGSSCHLKGAYQIIEGLKRYIEIHELADRVELKANFCAGLCQHAVSVKVDDEPCVQVDTERLSLFLAERLGGEI